MDSYDEDIEFLTANPDAIPNAWNQGCNLFVQRNGPCGRFGCPSQVKYRSHTVDSEWDNYIEKLNIPGVSAQKYKFDDGVSYDEFPIKIEHLQEFAKAQRYADELNLEKSKHISASEIR